MLSVRSPVDIYYCFPVLSSEVCFQFNTNATPHISRFHISHLLLLVGPRVHSGGGFEPGTDLRALSQTRLQELALGLAAAATTTAANAVNAVTAAASAAASSKTAATSGAGVKAIVAAAAAAASAAATVRRRINTSSNLHRANLFRCRNEQQC